LCAKGCNTTAWLKAKPEWAKGARLIRFTPRFNPDINSYWMCEIGVSTITGSKATTRLHRHWFATSTACCNGRGGTT
jgi:hypothetical protein